MHTYYLLVQWHRDPFNPLNDDVAYLHRCGIDDDDDDDDDTDEDDDHDDRRFHHSHSKHGHGSGRAKGAESPSNRSRNGSVLKRTLYDQVLCDTGMTLLRYRKIVWESIQQNVLEMIEKLDMAYGTNVKFRLCSYSFLILTSLRFVYCWWVNFRLQDGAYHCAFTCYDNIYRNWRGIYGSAFIKVSLVVTWPRIHKLTI